MKHSQQKEFIRNLCNSIRDEMLQKSKDFPESWDGVELRELLSIKFDRERYPMDRKRKREFINDYITLNL